MLTTADWIGLGIAIVAWGGVLWCFFLFGSYEMTGTRGWRRIPAGARLALDVLLVKFSRWEAKMRRRREE